MKLKLLLALSLGVVSSAAYAAEWSIKPIFNPNVEYDDNVLLSSTDEEGSFKFSVKPSVEAGYATESANLGIVAGYNVSRYGALSRLNEDDPFFRFFATKNTERAEWGLTASYSEDASRNTAEEDTGNFSSTSVITSRSISPSYTYSVSERDTLSLNASYSEREYSTNEFSDNETKSLSASWQRQYSERLSGNILTSYSLYESGTSLSGTENDTYGLSVGANYLFSERWTLSGQVGTRYLEQKQIVSGISSKDSNFGTTLNASAVYNSGLDEISLTASRELSPASNGDVNEQDAITVTWNRDLTETLTLNVAGIYRETTSASDEDDEKRENITFKPSLNWKLSPKMSMSFNYEYREQKRDNQGKADSNAIFVGISYDWDGYRVSR